MQIDSLPRRKGAMVFPTPNMPSTSARGEVYSTQTGHVGDVVLMLSTKYSGSPFLGHSRLVPICSLRMGNPVYSGTPLLASFLDPLLPQAAMIICDRPVNKWERENRRSEQSLSLHLRQERTLFNGTASN
jgi:hypothetical protein